MFLMCPNSGSAIARGGYFGADPTHFSGHCRMWYSKVNFLVIKDNEAFLSGGEVPQDTFLTN